MANVTKKAAELYLVLGVLATSLLADNETTTLFYEEGSSQMEIDLSSQIVSMTSVPSEATIADDLEGDVEAEMEEPVEAQAQSQEREHAHTMPGSEHPTVSTEPVRHGQGRGFPMPHFHRPDSRWGPFFEEGSEPHNITARVGSTVMLDCRIGLLQDKTVSWLHHKENSMQLLTVGKSAYSRDERITLSFRYPNNYRLEIVYVTRRDEGLYECQVATHPPKVKRIFLKVTAPEVRITDESGREMTERYYKAGSGLELTCQAKQVGASSVEHPITWRHGERTLSRGINTNVSTALDSAISTLAVAPLEKKDSGNYTCAVGSLAFATVAVHVLNGELPAAVHHGNSAPPSCHSFHLMSIVACVVVVCLR